MNILLLAGIVFAILLVLAYVATAAKKDKKPELVDGIVVFVGAVSVLGAVRLAGFVIAGDFAKIASTNHSANIWALSSEDAVFIVIGGLALGWVSIQTIMESFAKLSK